MRKNSKPPEERRRELVTVASRLFSEKGYEAVSVRDILDAVHGAPGMFYYYFKSKQDIYLATIEQYLSERIERRCQVLEDANVSFDEKQTAFHQLLQEDIAGYCIFWCGETTTPLSVPGTAEFTTLQGTSTFFENYPFWLLHIPPASASRRGSCA